MWPVTDRFLEAMRGSHTLVERARVIDPTGDTIRALDELDGRIVESQGALIRHSGQGTYADPTRDLYGLLGRHARVLLEVGVEYADGDIEWVPEMTGHIAGRDRGPGTIAVDLADRMLRCQRSRLLTTVIPGATPTPEAAYRLLAAADPGLRVSSLMTSPWVVPQLVYPPLTNLAEQAKEAAEAAGGIVWVDRLDGAVVSPRPAATNPPVWSISETDPTFVPGGCRVVEPENSLPNIVIVTSQHSAFGMVQGVARTGDWEDNPIVWPVSTEKVMSEGQAIEMAQALLMAAQSGSEEITVELATSVPHLMAGDVIDLHLPSWGVVGPAVLHERRRQRVTGTGATLTLRRGVQVDEAA